MASEESGILRLTAGSIVDEVYVVKSELGHGGMATVYEAWQSDVERFVALKIISLERFDAQDIRRRFFNELLLATRVKHPNIVEVFDFGLLPNTGHPYIVMERLYGYTLRDWLKTNGPMAPERAVSLFLGALSALGAAHSQGVVHKDIKPTNLFISQVDTPEESLVVLDFGVAQRLKSEVDTSDQYTGTPRYTAPEYIVRRQITPQLDVYQLGLVFVEAMIGRPVVLSKDPFECLRIHLEGRLDLPDAILKSPLANVIQKSLALEPESRLQNAQEFHDSLARVAQLQSNAPPGRTLDIVDQIPTEDLVPDAETGDVTATVLLNTISRPHPTKIPSVEAINPATSSAPLKEPAEAGLLVSPLDLPSARMNPHDTTRHDPADISSSLSRSSRSNLWLTVSALFAVLLLGALLYLWLKGSS